jgi:hypothetical protein
MRSSLFNDKTGISKGGILGALSGIILALFNTKKTDSQTKTVIKSGIMGAAGYAAGDFVEKKLVSKKEEPV